MALSFDKGEKKDRSEKMCVRGGRGGRKTAKGAVMDRVRGRGE